ncbi:hypothetical protein GH733_019656 [Mirounga leonina]|nr:hypothetical protein GH733_019660 [Mirounga leonina]KAF3812368.1 hypothetical protein GH733_019656 [Mirounga leonina]
MGSEYKRIILLKGLELINDYQFSIVKSLLAHDLGLTTNMQEEYNKVKIADLMERKFPGAACVDKLIDLFKDMPPLKDIVKQLRNEKMKGDDGRTGLGKGGMAAHRSPEDGEDVLTARREFGNQ